MKILFTRNAPILLFHDQYELDKKELKEISSKLRDLNLSIINCFGGYKPFITYLNVFRKLTFAKLSMFLDRVYSNTHQYKFEAHYSGAKLDSLLFSLNTVREINNLIICEDTNITNFYPVNKKEFVIDVNKEKVFSGEELERLSQYVTIDLQSLNREVDNDIYSKEDLLTPIVIDYKNQKYCIGFVYSSNVVLIILNLKLDILKDRGVLGKLLIYFHKLASHRLSLYEQNFGKIIDYENPYCLNLSNRKERPIIVEIKKEDVYDGKFKKLTVGSDFEFNYMDDDGYVVSAYEILCEYVYYDIEEEYLEDKLLTEYIGTDGDKTIGEIRTPVCNLNKKGCAKLIRYIKGYSRLAEEFGAMGGLLISFSNSQKATGFHIHLGFEGTPNLTEREREVIAANFSLLLDIILASHLIVLNKERRINSQYSNFTNYETKHYGFEYRSLPSSIIYKKLFFNVLEIFRKVARDYFSKNYVLVEVENFERVSEKFYKRYLGENYKNYFATIEELRDVIRKYELSIDLPSTDYYKVRVSREFEKQLEKYLEIIKNINTNYVKNCIVEFEVHTGHFIIIEQKYDSYIPLVSDYFLYRLYIPREEKFYEDYKAEFSKNLYELIKKLEKNSNLVYDSEKVYENLCKALNLPKIKESSLVLV